LPSVSFDIVDEREHDPENDGKGPIERVRKDEFRSRGFVELDGLPVFGRLESGRVQPKHRHG
jgi:hypothetical protein